MIFILNCYNKDGVFNTIYFDIRNLHFYIVCRIIRWILLLEYHETCRIIFWFKSLF